MTFDNKNILIVSPQPWSHIFVSKHHYAVHLSRKNNNVYFLNPPLKGVKYSIKSTLFDNLYEINYDGFIKGFRLLPGFIQKNIISKVYNKLQELSGVSFDVIWSFDNSVFFNFDYLPNKVLKIAHLVDLNQNFNLEVSSRTADICLASSNVIKEKISKYNSNIHFIQHGVLLSDFNKNSFYINNNKVTVGYAGNLDIEYIDWELIETLLKKYSYIDFYFAGTWENLSLKSYLEKNYSNLKYLGILDSKYLLSFYNQLDILSIMYDYQKFGHQLSNPHKMMEYLASGKMIIATWTDEYDKLQKEGLIKMTKSSSAFLTTFDEILKNINTWNSSKLVNQRISYARNNSYDIQISKIEKLV